MKKRVLKRDKAVVSGKKNAQSTAAMILGLLLLTAAVFLLIYNLYDARQAEKVSATVLPQLETEMEKTGPETEETDGNPDREMPAVEIDGYRYLGVLEIPVLDRKLPVMEEWDMGRLKKAVCRYAGSVYKDNMVIAGHNYRKHFSTIKNLPTGTEVFFTDVENQTYAYQIGWIDVLEADAVEEMVTGNWDLTLFTCTYGGGSRYAVRCIRVNE